MERREFIAPGRVEIGGNHTDHQHGRVLAAAVDLTIRCTAVPNNDNVISIESEGYPRVSVELNDLNIRDDERETTASLVRGVAAWFAGHGHRIGGFDATVSSTIPAGSGLSSSAAFEVLIANVLKGLYGAELSQLEIAIAGKYAENNYFGKPSGLMDQAASSFGSLSLIDFSDPGNATVTPVKAELPGYEMCVVNTDSSHADLTPDYAAIVQEMRAVAEHFGKEYLNDVDPELFYRQVSGLRQAAVSDRAVLRAMHFFSENGRVLKQAEALQKGDIKAFFELIKQSGLSSLSYLQNVFTPSDVHNQGLTLALALSEKILSDKGAWRVHGGGFAGTILAFVPVGLKAEYERCMCDVFGSGSCHFLNISEYGGREVVEN